MDKLLTRSKLFSIADFLFNINLLLKEEIVILSFILTILLNFLFLKYKFKKGKKGDGEDGDGNNDGEE